MAHMLSGRHSARAFSIRSRRTLRLGSPVRASKRARWLILASAILRSVMSSTRTTMPPFSIGWTVNSSVRPFTISTAKAASSLPESWASRRSIRLCALRADSRPALTTPSTKSRYSRALQLEIHRQSDLLAQFLICDDDAAIGIEHAQAMRHIVQCSIESRCQQRHVARYNHRIEQRAAQSFRYEFYPEVERDEKAGKNPMKRISVKQQRRRHRRPRA